MICNYSLASVGCLFILSSLAVHAQNFQIFRKSDLSSTLNSHSQSLSCPLSPPLPFQLFGKFDSRNGMVGNHLSDDQSQLGIFTKSWTTATAITKSLLTSTCICVTAWVLPTPKADPEMRTWVQLKTPLGHSWEFKGCFSELSLTDRNVYPLALTLHRLKLSCTFGLYMAAAVWWSPDSPAETRLILPAAGGTTQRGPSAVSPPGDVLGEDVCASSTDTLPSRETCTLSTLECRGLTHPPKSGNSAGPSQLQSIPRSWSWMTSSFVHMCLHNHPSSGVDEHCLRSIPHATLLLESQTYHSMCGCHVCLPPLLAREAAEKEVENVQLAETCWKPKVAGDLKLTQDCSPWPWLQESRLGEDEAGLKRHLTPHELELIPKSWNKSGSCPTEAEW